MLLVAIIGPHGSGKDSVVDGLVRKLNLKTPNLAKRALFTVTRPARADEMIGKDILVVSSEKFDELLKNGKIYYYENINGYNVGTELEQLTGAEVVVCNMTLSGVKKNREVLPESVKIFSILLRAPLEQRAARILKRSRITQADLEKKLKLDVSQNLEEKEFNLVVDNSDGQLEQGIQAIFNNLFI